MQSVAMQLLQLALNYMSSAFRSVDGAVSARLIWRESLEVTGEAEGVAQSVAQ